MKSLYFVLICLVAISDNTISSNTEHLSETQKESIFEAVEQRKLAEDYNYIIIYFNKEVAYGKFQNNFRKNISKIMVNNVQQSLENPFIIPLNTSLEVYFEGIINSFGYFFDVYSDENAKFISSIDFSHFDWSQLNSMHNLFDGLSSLKSIDLSNFDLSKVNSMEYTFSGCSSLESVTLPENLQNVETMEFLFSGCSALKSIDFSNFDLTKVTNMKNMFENCISLESVNFPKSLQNVKQINHMFFNCHYNQ